MKLLTLLLLGIQLSMMQRWGFHGSLLRGI